MKKGITYTLAATIAFSGVTTVSLTDASAATYKIKSGKLVNSKTGKVVKSTIIYKKKLYKNGVLTKGSVVYKNNLYKNSVLAKGTILYKSTLYVNGKIKSGTVKYNNKFYRKGKVIAKDKKFLYNDKLYMNNKIVKGYATYDGTLYKDGEAFDGIYKNNYYDMGYKMFEGDQTKISAAEGNDNSTFYGADGSTITYKIPTHVAGKISANVKNISVSNGAKVESAKTVKDTQNDSYYLVVTLSNTAKDKTYTLTINNLKLGNLGTLTYKTKVVGLPTKLANLADYKEVYSYYTKYKDITAAQLKALKKTKEYENAYYKLSMFMGVGEEVSTANTYPQFRALITELYEILDFYSMTEEGF